MTTSLFNKLLKIAVAFSALCMLAFTNLNAATGPNLLVNSAFESLSNTGVPDNWSGSAVQYYPYDINPAYTFVFTQQWPWENPPAGFDNYVMMGCVGLCPDSKLLAQKVNGLVSGHQYQLSYYTLGYLWTDVSEATGKRFSTGPLLVSLGSQQATPVVLQTGDFAIATPWVKQIFTFNYSGPSSSAWLTFFKTFSSLVTAGCVPCQDRTYLANTSLVDVTPTAPLLRVQKALGTAGRINDSDQFLVAIRNASTSAALNSASTSGTGRTITGGLASITGDTTTTYKVTEEMAAGSNSKLVQYDAALSCSNANSSGTQFPSGSIQVGQNFPLLKAGDDVTCTLTNTPKAPVLRLTKALGTAGRINNADQFTVLIQQRLSDVASGTTVGTGSSISAGTTGWTNLVSGTSYTLNEVMTAGSASKLGRYTGVVGCSNTFADSPTSVPLVPGTAFTPTYGDVLDCTLTNKPTLATLTVTQKTLVTAPATFNPPVKLSYTGTNGWTLQQNSSTVLNVVTTGARQTLTVLNVDTALSVALPTTETGWRIVSIRCTDTNATVSANPLPPTVVVSSTTNSITIPAAYVVAGAALQCAVIGSRLQ